MRRRFLPLAALALLGLSACGGKAKNEAAEANETLAGDSNTMGEAVRDVDAATAAAQDSAMPADTVEPANASEGAVDGNESIE